MWTANRLPAQPTRTPSVRSFSSVRSNGEQIKSFSPGGQHYSQAGDYDSDLSSDTAADEDLHSNMAPAWVSQRQPVSSFAQRFQPKAVPVPVKTQLPDIPYFSGISPAPFVPDLSKDEPAPPRSRGSTLQGEEDDSEFPMKTPTPFSHGTAAGSHVPGPLESQLAALMSKLVFMEQENPTVSVTPEEYQAMSKRLADLEEEKKTWTKRHEAIWALRDEDVENNIKIRGMLAKARRELEGMTKLRDDDLTNLQAVRVKLAEATRQLEKLQGSGGKTSPVRGRPGSTAFERRQTTDLFAVAKAAALEQRAMELEKRNSDLVHELESLRGSIGTRHSTTSATQGAHESTIRVLESKLMAKEAEVQQLRASSTTHGTAAPLGVEWHRVEAIHEEHASYRERMGGKLQGLRTEKEQLVKTLHDKEDECHALELKVQSLQRRMML